MKWVFAEDKDISEGVTGKFTLEISGCSRPELNGNYVQQTEYYYRRPIFHCQEKERYLFYHGKRHPVIPPRKVVWVVRLTFTQFTPLKLFSKSSNHRHNQPFPKLRQQWQIFSRTGTYASARLKTSRAAHMPGDGTMWAVWRSGASHFVFRLDGNFNPSLEAKRNLFCLCSDTDLHAFFPGSVAMRKFFSHSILCFSYPSTALVIVQSNDRY